MKKLKPFHFKQFHIHHDQCAMKVGTDGVLLGGWANFQGAESILDIGTGSGLIAIMAAQKSAAAKITGIEIDKKSFEQSLINVQECPWAERINIALNSFQDFIKNNTNSFEHIVSNPPFFEAGSLPTEKERLDARHTSSLSLEELINGCEKLLPLQGRCSFILPQEQAEKLIEFGIKKDLNLSRITYVQPLEHKKVERVLLELTKGIKKTIGPQKLIIQHKGRNNWTDAYISLTKDFYLKM